jgi:glycosyltransferase involved in cell wall biosynthesis
MKKLLSVVVPAYNEEGYIERCLASLNKQTVSRHSYEIILADNGSQDNTVKLAERYVERVVCCSERSAGHARNAGARKASAQAIAFVDADTVVAETWVEGAINGLKHAVACTGPFDAYDRQGADQWIFFKSWSAFSQFMCWAGLPSPPGFNIAVKKDAFWRVGGFNPSIICEDIELARKLRALGNVSFEPKMRVFTSARRVAKIGILAYWWNGASYLLLHATKSWRQYRQHWRLNPSKTIK